MTRSISLPYCLSYRYPRILHALFLPSTINQAWRFAQYLRLLHACDVDELDRNEQYRRKVGLSTSIKGRSARHIFTQHSSALMKPLVIRLRCCSMRAFITEDDSASIRRLRHHRRLLERPRPSWWV